MEVGGVALHLHLDLFGALHHGGFGVHRGEQSGDRSGVAQSDRGVVPQLHDAEVARLGADQFGDALAGGLQLAGAPLVEPGEPVVGGEFQRFQGHAGHTTGSV